MTQRLKYTELAPAGIATMRSTEHYLNSGTMLEPVLLELVRLRASSINGCEYCVGMHTHELRKHNEPQSRIDAVAGWRTSDAFTQRERAAFAWTEIVTDIGQSHAPDEAYRAALEHFSETELVNLTIAIASIGMWNRMAIAFRAEHREKTAEPTAPEPDSGRVEAEPEQPGSPAQDAAHDDGGKVSVED